MCYFRLVTYVSLYCMWMCMPYLSMLTPCPPFLQVGSMDTRLSQYGAVLLTLNSRQEIVTELTEAAQKLLVAFHARNGKYPEHIVVYRDGVSDGQFSHVITQEGSLIRGALDLCGVVSAKISIVVCQKRHNTRVAFEHHGKLLNPCPGVVIDARGDSESIVSGDHNEFYLNSQVSIQGTAKPCKYSLIYDEIGFKLSELELLTYWTTYCYARCNRSVSYATPAYYAHWASQRGKELLLGGGTNDNLREITDNFLQGIGSMFFV
ncbi:hypothetical protein EON65_27870 [archaeon]|nr:MAG: hypothetical protein EON65_27870 [archaeon]